jgi:hypothetical protein
MMRRRPSSTDTRRRPAVKVPANTKDFRMNQTDSSIDNVISAADVNAIASDKPGRIMSQELHWSMFTMRWLLSFPVILRPIQFLSGEQSGAQKKAIRLK